MESVSEKSIGMTLQFYAQRTLCDIGLSFGRYLECYSMLGMLRLQSNETPREELAATSSIYKAAPSVHALMNLQSGLVGLPQDKRKT